MWSTSLQLETPLLAFSSVKAFAPIWHSRLGHLSNKLVFYFVASNQILISSGSLHSYSYNSCKYNKSHKLTFMIHPCFVCSFISIFYLFYVWTSPIPSKDCLHYYFLFLLITLLVIYGYTHLNVSMRFMILLCASRKLLKKILIAKLYNFIVILGENSCTSSIPSSSWYFYNTPKYTLVVFNVFRVVCRHKLNFS